MTTPKEKVCICGQKLNNHPDYCFLKNSNKEEWKEEFKRLFPRFQFSINQSPWDRTERLDGNPQLIIDFIEKTLAAERARVTEQGKALKTEIPAPKGKRLLLEQRDVDCHNTAIDMALSILQNPK